MFELNDGYFRPLLPSTIKYLDRLNELSEDESKRHLLFAHVYVRHMGDLYGGKLIARLIPGSGRMYQFDDRPRLIKAFNEKLTMDLVDEANLAFDYYISIFDELYANL